MPSNKSAIIRHQILDRCLRDTGSSWTKRQMTDEVSRYLIEELGHKKGISESMIEKDLAFMQSSEGYLAPIEKEKRGKEWVWYYSSSRFSITNSPLDKEDAQKLKEVIELLRTFENLPQLQDLEEMLLKLESKTIITKANQRPVVQMETNSLAHGNKHLRPLYKSITVKRAITITYKPFGKDAYIVEISPYLLKEYNNRWFLFGKNRNSGKIQNLALDRIEHIERSELPLEDDPGFQPEEYFRHVIGVSVSDNPPEKIRLKFTAEQANYVITKPIHESQKSVKQTKSYLEIELHLIVNYELKKLIWSFGDSVEVITPSDLLTRQLRK